MPEGDTIFRAARTLHQALAGKEVTHFETALAQLARVDDDAPLRGRTVEKVWAQGKHLLISFSGDLILRTHMRMNGSWHIYRPGEAWHRARSRMRVVVQTADFVAVGFDLPVADFFNARSILRDESLKRLGPDLLGGSFDVAEAARRLRARSELRVGEALLNQRVLAGVGNVFKSEILFLSGVHPERPVHSLSDPEVGALLDTAERLLKANAGAAHEGGIARWVYGRSGQPCRKCGERIGFAKQGPEARVTYWCPRCQPVKTQPPV